jgi:hypothetical protein
MEYLTATVVILSVALLLMATRVVKSWTAQESPTEFNITCPHCGEIVSVEMQLHPLGVEYD